MKYTTESKFVYGLLIFYYFAQNLMVSVTSVYLLSKGINYVQLNSLDSILLIVALFLEVPTGIVGDRFGHKISFQISMILRSLYLLLLTLASSFLVLVILAVIMSFSEAFWSGSFVSWYINKTKNSETDSEHINIFSNLVIITSLAGMLAGFVGATISKQSISFGYYIASGMILLSAFALLFISDPEHEKKDKLVISKVGVNSTFNIISSSLKFFLNINKEVFLLILGLFFGYITISGIDNFWQPMLLSMSNNISLLGYSWIVIRLGTFFSGIIAKRISKSNKHTMSLAISVSISALALLILRLTGNWIIGSIAFSIHAMSWVVFSTVSNGLLYRHIPNNSKATILSGISMFNTIAGVIGLTVYAIVADNKLENAFLLASFSMFLLFLLTSIRNKKA